MMIVIDHDRPLLHPAIVSIFLKEAFGLKRKHSSWESWQCCAGVTILNIEFWCLISLTHRKFPDPRKLLATDTSLTVTLIGYQSLKTGLACKKFWVHSCEEQGDWLIFRAGLLTRRDASGSCSKVKTKSPRGCRTRGPDAFLGTKAFAPRRLTCTGLLHLADIFSSSLNEASHQPIAR